MKDTAKKCCYSKMQVLFKDKEKRRGRKSERVELMVNRGVTILLLNSFGTR